MKIKRATLIAIRFWFVVGLLGVLLFSCIRLYLEKDWFTIRTYTITGIDEEKREILLKRIEQNQNGVSLFIFPENKILSYSHREIVSLVKEVVPSTKKVTIYPQNFNVLYIAIEEFIPIMKRSPQEGITKEGIIFTTNRSLDDIPLFVGDISTSSTKVHGVYMSKIDSFDESFFTGIHELIKNISVTLFPIIKIEIDKEGDIRLYNKTLTSYVMVTKKTDFRKAWSTLLSAIDTDPLKAKLGTEMSKLSYIDLRFGNKVFYSFSVNGFQNASSTDIINDHVTETASSTEE